MAEKTIDKILNGILKLIGYMTVSILFIILILYLTLFIWLGNMRDESNEEKLIKSHSYDHQAFPYLANSIFFYMRMHVGDEGNWVVVYPLDAATKDEFLLRYQYQENQHKTQYVECITPTLKKRWKSWYSNIHYVQPSEWAKGHNDYKVHDSFIVYGSEKYIKTVERSCTKANFKILNDSKKFSHGYWAISEQEDLLFSVYNIN